MSSEKNQSGSRKGWKIGCELLRIFFTILEKNISEDRQLVMTRGQSDDTVMTNVCWQVKQCLLASNDSPVWTGKIQKRPQKYLQNDQLLKEILIS